MNQMEAAMFAARGYGPITFVVKSPRLVVASCHKVIRGVRVEAAALGIDRIDAERKLVRVVTRP